MTAVANLSAVYFGCWDRVGHGYHLPGGGRVKYNDPHARDVTPWGYGVEKLAPHTMTQGTAALHHKDGWTALAVDDFTVDSRGNSKSVFCFPAELDLDATLAEAERLFPVIVRRVGPITSARHATPVSDSPQGQT